MSEVTRILSAIEQGDPHAAEQLLPLVYDELRQLAALRLAQEKPGQTLQATALVHEVYLRLVGTDANQPWDNRGHFFAAAAEAMRRILVENARRKRGLKYGGDRDRQSLDPDCVASPEVADELVALDEALTRLEATEPKVAELVKLRYFAGLTIPQAAAQLQISPRTADAWWSYAKAWFQTALEEPPDIS
jgi:RNA polymerase sigma factor (TIGR02999 family)